MLSRFASFGLETMPTGSGKLLNLSFEQNLIAILETKMDTPEKLGNRNRQVLFP